MTWFDYFALGYAAVAVLLWLAVRENARSRGTMKPPLSWLPSMPLMIAGAFIIVLWMRACR